MTQKLKISKDIQNQVQKEVQKTLNHQLKDTIEFISDKKMNKIKKIHEIRKKFKKIRALLKLIKFDLKDKNIYRTQNDYYKYAGKRFSNSRDAIVLLKTYQTIIEKYHLGQQVDNVDFSSLKMDKHKKDFQELKKELLKKRTDLDIYQLKKKKHPLKKGLKKIYKKLKKNKKLAYKKYDDETFHEWRKAVKNYMYQLKLLKKPLSKKIKKKNKKLKKLADYLGDDHDIAVLKEFICSQNKNDPMLKYLKKEQKKLRKKASKIKMKKYKKAVHELKHKS